MKIIKNIATIFIVLIILSSMSFTAMGLESDKIIGYEGELIIIEKMDVPINPMFSEEKLEGINVSYDTLQEFSRFYLGLKEQSIDTETEKVDLIYIDDDLQRIPNAWVFTTSDYKPILESSKSSQKEEMIKYLSDFEQKYPSKRVSTGFVSFLTVENKEKLLSEISEKDEKMLENISEAIIEVSSAKNNEKITSKWGASNPNVHGDMSGWAAEKAGFNSTYVSYIKNNATRPDYFNVTEIVQYWVIPKMSHYYNPSTRFGTAPNTFNKFMQKISGTSSKPEKARYLSYASHYMCDMSMPLHTKYATEQVLEYIPELNIYEYELVWPQSHFVYEDGYVGANWTTGLKFYQDAKNTNFATGVANPNGHITILANWTNSQVFGGSAYADTVWNCTVNSDFSNRTLQLSTGHVLCEGQAALNGLMIYARNNGL